MLRHLNCMLGGNRAPVKSEATGINSTASAMALGNDASLSMSAKTRSVVDISAVAANGDGPASSPGPRGDAPVGRNYPVGLSGDLITLLPAGTGNINLTCRLFSSFGKLLTHFEDDLYLYPSTDAARSLVRDPIAFEIPEVADFPKSHLKLKKSDNEEQQQRNYCNNWQVESRRSSYDNSERVVRVESPSLLTTSTISSLFSATANTNSVRKANNKANSCYDYKRNFRVDRSCPDRCSSDYYFGPIGVLQSNFQPKQAALTPSCQPRFSGGGDHRLGIGSRQKLQRCRPLSPPLLLELDGLSGRTEALGCVPSVPVARSRLVTHRGRGRGGRDR